MPRVTITVIEKTPQPYRFDLKREIVTVGRGQDNDIVIGCGSVSGKHCEMHRVKGGYHLIDVASTNGIKIDGIRHQTVVLHTGMTVKLGDVEFGFSLNEEELAELASEAEPTGKPAIGADEDRDEEDEDDDTEVKDIKKEEVPEKTLPKVDLKKEEEKEKEKEKIDDGPDKLPDLAPVRLNKRKEKQEKEAEEKKKAEREERAERRKKREEAIKSEKNDEYSESKAVTIGSGFILFALIAVAAAFFYGASTRHEKDTGDSLLKGIVNKEDSKNDSPKDVDDKADGGTE